MDIDGNIITQILMLKVGNGQRAFTFYHPLSKDSRYRSFNADPSLFAGSTIG